MASKSNGLDASEWARAPPSGPAWRRCLKAIYDPQEKSFLGRTPKRWGIVFTFYAVFYAVLALLFGLCFGGLLLSLDKDRPTYTLEKSLIGKNPGVAHRPLAVYYQRDNSTPFVEQLDEFFAPYEGDPRLATQAQCVSNDTYGYPDSPCVYVKLNKIYDWKPDYYDDASSLPADMPADLVEHIKLLEPAKRKQIWISCAQEKGNSTNIEYPWGRGLPGRYYPFINQEGYRSPLVAVKFGVPANTLVVVRCRAWAKNIIYNKSIKDPSGYTRFSIFIEDNANTEATQESV